MLPLGPPDEHGSPYKSRVGVRGLAGLLADPAAPVVRRRGRRVPRAQAFWIGDWERVAGGRRAVADQVRFEREWGALRALRAPSAACG